MPRENIGLVSSADASRFNFKLLETLAGNRTITLAEIDQYQGFNFDPGGAGRDVSLPAEEACKGVVVLIGNKANAAEVLTIKNDGGDTLATPTQAEAAVLWCDGVRWTGLVGASS